MIEWGSELAMRACSWLAESACLNRIVLVVYAPCHPERVALLSQRQGVQKAGCSAVPTFATTIERQNKAKLRILVRCMKRTLFIG